MSSSDGLAGRVVSVRLRLGLSQGAFAARIGVTRNMVIRYERHGQHPRAETLARIAEVGGVTSEWLLNGVRRRAQPVAWDPAWEEALRALRAAWKQPRRRRTVLRVLKAVGPQRAQRAVTLRDLPGWPPQQGAFYVGADRTAVGELGTLRYAEVDGSGKIILVVIALEDGTTTAGVLSIRRELRHQVCR